MADFLDVANNLLGLATFLFGWWVRSAWPRLRDSLTLPGHTAVLLFWGGVAGSLVSVVIMALVALQAFGGPVLLPLLEWEWWNG